MSSSDKKLPVSPPDKDEGGSIYRLSPGLRDYICGTISGCGKVVAGHPFDTIKGRVQTGQFPSVVKAAINTLRYEGPLAFYQGVTMPAINVCFVGGILFYVNGAIRLAIQKDPTDPLSYTQMFLAGSGAGFCVGCVVTPLEVVKLRLQIVNRKKLAELHEAHKAAAGTPHSSKLLPLPAATVLEVFRALRPVDFFAGITPTIIRECGTFGIFFPVNEYLKRKVAWYKDGIDIPSALAAESAQAKRRRANGNNTNDGEKTVVVPNAPFSTRVLAAGTAGVLCWLPIYPSDQMKSRMQVQPAHTYRSWLHCAMEIYKENGLYKGFYRGIEPCLLRAFPAYSAQYLLYEKMVSILKG